MIHLQRRVRASHIARAFDGAETRISKHARQRFKIVAVFMRLEKIGGLRTGTGISQEILQARRIFRPPRSGLSPVAEEVLVIVDVGFDTLLDVRDPDAHDSARRKHAAQLSKEGLDVAWKEKMLQQVRNKDVAHAAGGEWQAP